MPERRMRWELRSILVLAALVVSQAIQPTRISGQAQPAAPKTVRLYVFDCGVLTTCGDGVCDILEDHQSCPADCP